MAIWIQALSWTLIFALGQGFLVYLSLRLVLKISPAMPANVKYHLSLSALTVMLGWFVATLWQQYHAFSLLNAQIPAVQTVTLWQQIQATGISGGHNTWHPTLLTIAPFIPWLSVLYMAGLVFMLARLSVGSLQLFWLKKIGNSHPGVALDELLVTLKKRINYDGSVRLMLSVKAQVPMVIGYLKPIILLPAATIDHLNIEQLETILLHELAHIKRHDYLINILQAFVETILFFNPFVWLVSAIIRREREHCCDDLVLDHTREPLFYATALAALASGQKSAPALALAATGQSNHLFNRIQRIMEMKKNPFSYSRMAAAILIISATSCSLVWLTPAFARSGKDKQSTAKTTTPALSSKDTSNASMSEEQQLAQRLMADHIVDEVKGFIVEKKQNALFINGKQQSAEIAGKYLSTIKQSDMRIQVNSFMERMKQHPGANLIQIIAPMTFSSGCVEYSKKKPGC